MTRERRYRDDEIEMIFEAASAPEEPRRHGHDGEGLTLAELQEIGREVGIPPTRIADAAAAIAGPRAALQRRNDLGLPIAVGRTAELARMPTEREWATLVGELRETFRARGREVSSGGSYGWTNGNLHAYAEPTENGYRFRIGTLKGDAAPMNRLGLAAWIAALVMVALILLGVDLAPGLPVPLAVMGSAAYGYNAVTLPGWARERERQMEHMVARATGLIRGDTESETAD